MTTIRVNAAAKVNNGDIRHITHNNRPHIIVPSYTLPDNVVMNGGLYPADEIAKSYKTLEDTPAPAGHPVVNGKFVKAKTIEAINAHHVGAWNKKVEAHDGRVYIEKWIDVQTAEQSETGRQLLDAINKGEPIHTSTGLTCTREAVTGQAGYTWIARNMQFDHDAILFGEPGAATPADGVGLMVNSAVQAVCPDLVVNGVLTDSYTQRREALGSAINEKFGISERWLYVEDFDADKVIFGGSPEGLRMTSYEYDGANAVLGDSTEGVKTKVEFVAKGAEVATQLAMSANTVQSKTTTHEEPVEMDEAKLATLIGNAVSTAVTPLQTQLAEQAATITQLQGHLTANADATDKANREVILKAKPELAIVANSLKGAELAALAATYQTADSINAGGELEANSKKDEFADYKGV